MHVLIGMPNIMGGVVDENGPDQEPRAGFRAPLSITRNEDEADSYRPPFFVSGVCQHFGSGHGIVSAHRQCLFSPPGARALARPAVRCSADLRRHLAHPGAAAGLTPEADTSLRRSLCRKRGHQYLTLVKHLE